MIHFTEITEAQKKSEICDTILRTLPDWFGDEDGILGYVKAVQKMSFLAVYDSEQVIGFVALEQHNPFAAEVHVMGILDKYHRRGIGSQLMAFCENYCREHNMQYLTVKTLAETHPDEHYAKTRLFYQAKGFCPLEVFPTLWDEWNPCLLMAKYIGEKRTVAKV